MQKLADVIVTDDSHGRQSPHYQPAMVVTAANAQHITGIIVGSRYKIRA